LVEVFKVDGEVSQIDTNSMGLHKPKFHFFKIQKVGWKGDHGVKKEKTQDFLSTDPYRNGREVFYNTLSIWII
jgi:hypothetical protein